MTVALGRPSPSDPGAAGARPGPRGAARAAWRLLPFLCVAALAASVLCAYEVSPRDVAVFGAFTALAVTLPGALLWRAAHRGSRLLAEDLAAGTAVGYAAQVLAYIPARAAGAPLLALVPPALTLAAFAAVPALRRHWRAPAGEGAAPLWWSWCLAGLFGVVVAWSGAGFFRAHGLSWPGDARPFVDLPFQLALAGELKHHVPPTEPTVLGTPLLYHWFVYAHLAASSWATGIELETLVHRLAVLPMAAALVVLVAVTARRLTGLWWTGPVAAGVSFLVVAPNPLAWTAQLVPSGALLDGTLWVSPTQTFGALTSCLAVLILVDLLRGGRNRAGWALLTLALAVTMGAKSTYIPLIAAGLTLVIVVHLVFLRRPHRPALLALALSAACGLFAQVALFGGARLGMAPEPLASAAKALVAGGVIPAWTDPAPALAVTMGVIMIVSWACVWSGVFGLAVRNPVTGVRAVPEAPVLMLLGIGAAAIPVVLLFGHPGGSEYFFLQAARPFLSLAAVCGLAALLTAARTTTRSTTRSTVPATARSTTRTTVPATARNAARTTTRSTARSIARSAGSPWWPVGAACAGAALTAAVRVAGGAAGGAAVEPFALGPDPDARLAHLIAPYLALACAVTLCAVGTALACRRLGAPRGLSGALVISLVTGLGLVAAPERARFTYEMWPLTGPAGSVPRGAREAGRWLRDHSRPDDVVATNAHCAVPGTARCDNRHFWVSGLSERRVLVEGWGYSAGAHARVRDVTTHAITSLPFWDPERLADNDTVFRSPTAAGVRRLRERYGVRWLFVDTRYGRPAPPLDGFARLRHRSGACAVYEIP
ncbi:hypothetical protein GCM10010517_80680 [Streptosporangium fragile]|uniref:Glycosyltransferase RgtA/B/C/D-like domain-containing protein n=1 Tax=Streptosporangium fragile TaxID=46186 RepID=A0ABP6IYH5_9ACTN